MYKPLFLLFITIQITFAQTPANQALIDKAIAFYLAQDLKKAEETYQFALEKSIQSHDSIAVLSCYANLYSCFSMQDKPLDFLKYEKQINIYAASNNKFSCYTLQELGHVYRFMGEFEQAKKYYERAIKKYKLLKINDFRLSGTGFSAYGTLALETGDYDTAIFYFKQALQEFLKQKEVEEPNEIANLCIRLSTAYTRKQQFLAAKKYLNQGLKYAIQPSVKTNFYNVLAEIYLPENLNKPDSTTFFLKKAIEIAKSEGLDNRLGLSYLHSAKVEINAQNYKQAQVSLENAHLIFEKQQNKLRLGQAFQLKGLIAEKQKNNRVAFHNYTQALKYYSDGSLNTSIEKVLYKNEALKSITGQLCALLNIYQETKQIAILKQAFLTVQKADKIVDYQRNSLQLEASKLFLTQLSHDVYAIAIEICFQLFQATKDDSFLQEGFRFSEKNKAIVLYESLKFAQNQNFSGVPPTLIQKETILNRQIAFFENLIYRDEKKKPNQVAESRVRLLKTTEELEELKETFKDDYPEYYKFKYNTNPISTKELSKKLSNNQAVIEYFINKDILYSFLIIAKKSYFFKQTLPSDFKQNIVDFKNLMVAKSVSATYQSLSLKIYNILFPENINNIIISNKIENIEIIADAELNYIPFESLLTKKPKNLKEEGIYLLEKYTIAYLPSATMNWKSTIPKNNKWFTEKYIGFAPSYEKGLDLPENQANVAYLSNFFKGESFLKNAATKKIFEEKSQNRTKILHLSMHAGASDTDPMESYLVFGKDSLFVHEIYAKSIPADLAILDACETGVGILNNSEGVMNLSRAFLHAGSKSAAMSLWKLTSSPETAEIIKDFVSLVQNGKPKNEALRTAKLNFLKAHRKDLVLSHPFYWSPLILVGNPEAIAEPSWIWWIFGAIGLLLIIYLLMKNKIKA